MSDRVSEEKPKKGNKKVKWRKLTPEELTPAFEAPKGRYEGTPVLGVRDYSPLYQPPKRYGADGKKVK